jgi:hypothetical protein
MTTIAIDDSQRRAARIAGLWYLITFAIVVYANFAIHERLIVAGDAAKTGQNILAHETLFRVGIMCDLVYCIGMLIVLAALYVIQKPVSEGLTLIATLWKLAYVLTWFVMTLELFDALRLFHGAGYLRVFDTPHLQALAKISLSGRFDRYYGGLLFYALSGTVSSYLWLKSRYIPKALAVFGVAAFAWCAFCAFAFLLVPDFSKFVNLWFFDTAMGLFELALGFWLLIKGLPERV